MMARKPFIYRERISDWIKTHCIDDVDDELTKQDVIDWVNSCPNRGDVMRRFCDDAIRYASDIPKSVIRNRHMNNLRANSVIDRDVADAVIVDFLNYVAAGMCMDYGLYTRDLYPIATPSNGKMIYNQDGWTIFKQNGMMDNAGDYSIYYNDNFVTNKYDSYQTDVMERLNYEQKRMKR